MADYRLRILAQAVVAFLAATSFGSAITLTPAQATPGATIAATSGGNAGTPAETNNTSDSNADTSSEGNTTDGTTDTSDGNTGIPEQPPPSKPEPPAPPPPPPFLGRITATIEGQAGNAREGLGYHYEITLHNLGPGTLSGARLRVLLPSRYVIEDVGDRDRKLRTVVRHDSPKGLLRHWRVWRLADLAAGMEVKFTIHGHFAIRKRQSGNSFAATAAVVLPAGGRESDRDEVNVVRRRPNR